MHTAGVVAAGKFLESDGQRLLVKGVSYGTFAPDAAGLQFPALDVVARDFEAMAALGANTVRTYTPPSLAIMDEAARCGLRMMIGLPWPQHIAFLNQASLVRDVRRNLRDEIDRLAAHPATLMFAVGNEIPPSVVRWHGRRRIEAFLEELFEEGKSVAPEALLTYVNYPPTDYLELPFFDVSAWNVFLHRESELSAYLARLQNIAGNRPLLITEAGADSLRHDEHGQASLVTTQLRTAFREGVCGAVVFSWTDDWWRGGRVVDDWAFGLVDVERRPKLSYRAVEHVFQTVPFTQHDIAKWPRVSVVVCAYNAASTIDECLTSLGQLSYPDYEVIVINDGSTDDTGQRASQYPGVRVTHTANAGLSAARNAGLELATGEIVAYTDADVRVDRDWLTYLVQPFVTSDVVAAGGPNLVPGDDPWVAQCVARAPGAPTQILLDDRIAEHVPGCNCAFRREALLAIDGFNPTFLRAGDDVDVCWRLQARGWKIGFAPAALVWHRHRSSILGYLRQQVGYGEGESWLMHEHPDKFAGGRVAWRGHIYSPLPFLRSIASGEINAGPFGSAAFPSVYRTDAHPLAYLPHSGRWQVAWIALLVAASIAVLAGFAIAGAVLAISGVLALTLTAVKCVIYSLHSDLSRLLPIAPLPMAVSRGLYRLTIAALHFLQPFARVRGRIQGALSRPTVQRATLDYRKQIPRQPVTAASVVDALRLGFGRQVEKAFWSEQWVDYARLLQLAADRLRHQRAVRSIEVDDGWWQDRDVTIVDRAGLEVDLRILVEEHAGGRCLYRFGIKARIAPLARLGWVFGAGAAMIMATVTLHWMASALIGLGAAAFWFTNLLATSRLAAGVIAAITHELGIISLGADGKPLPSADLGAEARSAKAAPARAGSGSSLDPAPLLRMVSVDLTRRDAWERETSNAFARKK
jgi:GT2 family glycosyltransferase